MKSRQYWNRRYLFDKAGSANTGEDFLRDTVAPLYEKALKEIENEIGSMYGRFADQEKISLAEAKQKINRADFKKIDFEARAMGQAKRQRELTGRKDSLPETVVEAMERRHKKYESALAAYTKKGQISRLELLHVEIERILLGMYDENQINMYSFLAEQYRDNYYRAVFRNQQMAGFGKNFSMVNEDAVRKAVLNFYGRNNYSDALWKHCGDLSHSLRENITVGLIRGESLKKMAKRVSRRMEVSRSSAYRLVRTETAYIYEQAAMEAYRECGVEKYEYLATLDGKTSKTCQELDGKAFLLKDAVPGKNYPPMHPNCRSTTVAVFGDGEEAAGKRLAKNGNGKYYEVPGNMTYKEWKKQHIEEKEERDKKFKNSIGRMLDRATDLKEPLKLDNTQYGKMIRRIVEESRADEAELLLKYYDRIHIINTSPRIASYSSGKGGIRIDMGKAYLDERGHFVPLFHEIGHHMDDLLGRPSSAGEFRQALEEDGARIFRSLIAGGRCANMEEAYQYVSKNIRAVECHSVSDLLGGLTGNKCRGGYGHSASYWEQRKDGMEREAFAHFYEASLSGNEQKIEIIKDFFPAAFQKYKEMIRNG